MAYTDAWFEGEAVLDRIAARYCVGLDAVASCLAEGEAIAATSLDPVDLLALRFDLVVDARLRKRDRAGRIIGLAPFTVGCGPGFVAGVHADAVIETAWGDVLGQVILSGPSLPLGGEPRPILGVGRERYVYAPAAGVFATAYRIGGPVRAGEPVGYVGNHTCHAPVSGVLRGLAADGAEVRSRDKIVEVDPRDDPAACFGLGERPLRIAEGVLRALRQNALDRVGRDDREER